MINVSFYHKDTGMLNSMHFSTSDPRLIVLNCPADHLWVDGHHDALSKRVDVATKQVIDYQPPRESIEHIWDDNKKRWVLSPEALERDRVLTNARKRVKELDSASIRLLRDAVLQLMLGQDTTQSYRRLAGIEDELNTLRPLLDKITLVGERNDT